MFDKSRYRSENGKTLIEIKVKTIQQLFDVRDPAPFRERDLDDQFVEYVEACIYELSYVERIKLVLHIGESLPETVKTEAIIEAIHSHFSYSAYLKRLEMQRLLKMGQLFLVVGIIILAIIQLFLKIISLPSFLNEGFTILGWVILWKPLEVLCFDWYPVYQKYKNYKKLENLETEVKFP